MSIIIRNANYFGVEVDILCKDDKIAKIGCIDGKYDTEIDAKGLVVMPAFTDIHTHLREPGQEYKEDITSGVRAGVHGGYANLCCMPNTSPVVDNAYLVRYICDRACEENMCRVFPIGAITKGLQGETLAEMRSMKDSGAVAFSDDGRPVSNGNLMRLALEYAADTDSMIISHCEELSLVDEGMVNEGFNSTKSGLKGISRVAEEAMVSREILLAEALGTKVHIAHISTKGSAELVRQAKRRGVRVSAETCPHYFSANDSMILSYDTNTKVNPPLRTESDRLAIIEALADGTIDCIATDHAPHHFDEKNVEYMYAANGISGLETAFALGYTYLVRAGHISLQQLSDLMSVRPSRLLGLPCGEIVEGGRADLVLIDVDHEYAIDTADFYSKGKNTPFKGTKVYGKVLYTLINGDIKMKEGRVQ